MSRDQLEELTAAFLRGEIDRAEVEEAVYRSLQAEQQIEPAPEGEPASLADRESRFTTPTERAHFTLNLDEFQRHAEIARRWMPDVAVVGEFFTDCTGAVALRMSQSQDEPPADRPIYSLSHTFLDC